MKQIGTQLFVQTDSGVPAMPDNPVSSVVMSRGAMHTLNNKGTATSSVDLAIDHCLPALDGRDAIRDR